LGVPVMFEGGYFGLKAYLMIGWQGLKTYSPAG
jgi:hypothetical protein